LPTIEDLHITVDENVQLEEIGRIVSIVEVLGKCRLTWRSTFLLSLAAAAAADYDADADGDDEMTRW